MLNGEAKGLITLMNVILTFIITKLCIYCILTYRYRRHQEAYALAALILLELYEMWVTITTERELNYILVQ